MEIAKQGVYVTKNSVYYVIDKAEGGQALFKNNELIFDSSKVSDNSRMPMNILINDNKELEVENSNFKTTEYLEYYSMQQKKEFISGLEVIGSKISDKIEGKDRIKQDLFALRENKDVDFSLIKPIKELKENSNVFVYDKKAYGIAGCYIKIAKDFGYDQILLNNKNFKNIIRNMSLDTNGIAKEVVEEYEKSQPIKPKSF